MHVKRPLSPHLQIYRPQWSSVLSISHRITGVFLALGIFAFVLWLAGLAFSPLLFDCITYVLSSIFGQALLMVWTLFYFYHLSNGIRHLFWDFGKGLELQTARRSGGFVVASAVTLTLTTWSCIVFF